MAAVLRDEPLDLLAAQRRRTGSSSALAADFASGGGGGAGAAPLSSQTVDVVFGFGASFEESMAKANAAKGSSDPRAQVLGMLKAADAFAQARKFEEAAEEAETAQRLIQELRFEQGRACLMVVVAKVYARQGSLSTAEQLDEALDLASEAQEKFQKYGSKRCEAAALLALAAARHALKQHGQGNEAAKEAQALLQAIGDRAAEAEVLEVVADGYCVQEKYRQAVKMVSHAKAIQAELRDRQKEGECQHRVGQIELKAGNREQGLAAIASAQGIFKEVGNAGSEASCLLTLKDDHLRRGNLPGAIEAFQRIVTLYHDAGEAQQESASLVGLSELLLENEQLRLAQRTADSALRVAQIARDGNGVVKATDLVNRVKNASLKQEVKDSINNFPHTAHYPVNPVIEFGLNRQVPEMLEQVQRGL